MILFLSRSFCCGCWFQIFIFACHLHPFHQRSRSSYDSRMLSFQLSFSTRDYTAICATHFIIIQIHRQFWLNCNAADSENLERAANSQSKRKTEKNNKIFSPVDLSLICIGKHPPWMRFDTNNFEFQFTFHKFPFPIENNPIVTISGLSNVRCSVGKTRCS